MNVICTMGAIYLASRRSQSRLLRSFDISFQQLALIRLARRKGGLSPSAAALGLDCDRPTATIVTRNCVARGWIVKRRSKEDRRSFRLELTGEGEELIDRIDAAGNLIPGEILDILDTAEREGFVAALRKIEARASELFSNK